jgi:hypothetical protein
MMCSGTLNSACHKSPLSEAEISYPNPGCSVSSFRRAKGGMFDSPASAISRVARNSAFDGALWDRSSFASNWTLAAPLTSGE